ncbi:MAG TPA: pyridoxamine 5'-phosphate oxidase family protein [Clostridiales bacterium]|nr:pyridoxamine 5'-phosphate oxidase family protein [Clostridiales bacterium]
MQGKMRRKDRAMNVEEAYSFLAAAPVGRLATISENGYPYVVPVHFVCLDNKIYFHCAQEGHKLDNIKKTPFVCFEADEMIGIINADHPCDTSTRYKSVVIFGKARVVEDESIKIHALKEIIRKYVPESANAPLVPEILDASAVVEIEIEQMTGKASR